MNLYVKQKFFSWNDKFFVYDSEGNEVYFVEGEVFSLGKKLHLYSKSGEELAYIEQKLLSFLPKYDVLVRNKDRISVRREFTFFRSVYTVELLGWKVYGDFFDHEYQIEDKNGKTVCAVSKEWFTLGDAYEIKIIDDADVITALSVALVIDACIEENND